MMRVLDEGRRTHSEHTVKKVLRTRIREKKEERTTENKTDGCQ